MESDFINLTDDIDLLLDLLPSRIRDYLVDSFPSNSGADCP